MKRYMIKARSDMSPVKEKLKTALLREEVEERKKTAEEQGRKESEDKNWGRILIFLKLPLLNLVKILVQKTYLERTLLHGHPKLRLQQGKNYNNRRR